MDWRYNTIWFEQLEQSKIFQKDFKENTIISENKIFEKSEYAIIWYMKGKADSFDRLNKSDELLYLELHSANIENFNGIEKYRNLKRLELHYCTKLENDSGLSSLKGSLEYLHINQSKKMKFTDELIQLKKLKVLCLNDCAPIESLDFLKNFPQLIDFRFVNTNILDGNLEPILNHPTIRTVSYLNKRHYNYKSEEMNRILEYKLKNEYRTFEQKGEYETYRYDYD